jgi:hypothetical protein
MLKRLLLGLSGCSAMTTEGRSTKETYRHVAMVGEGAVSISLLAPGDHLDLLAIVAERYELDSEELLATARAALAAPDHRVEVSIGKSLVA